MHVKSHSHRYKNHLLHVPHKKDGHWRGGSKEESYTRDTYLTKEEGVTKSFEATVSQSYAGV